MEEAASILADSPAKIRRHYAKWTPEFQARQDRVTRMVHGTKLANVEFRELSMVARDGIAQHYSTLTIPLAGIYLDPKIDLRDARVKPIAPLSA